MRIYRIPRRCRLNNNKCDVFYSNRTSRVVLNIIILNVCLARTYIHDHNG